MADSNKMNIIEAIKQQRVDLQKWVANNLNEFNRLKVSHADLAEHTTEQQRALSDLKTELSESITSESDSWTIVDEGGNIVLKAGELDDDKVGLETTAVIANDIEATNMSAASVATTSISATTIELDGKDLTDKLGTFELKADAAEKLTQAKEYAEGLLEVDEAITVNLGSGGTVGGYKTGDVIAVDTNIKAILKKLLQKAVPATYTKPTITAAAKSTAAGSYEYGTSITAKITATFTQNNAGAIQSIAILKDGTEILTGTSNSLTSTAETFQLTSSTTYVATATYAEGAIKNNNLGEPSPSGHIEAGSITSSEVKFTPYRQGYFYGVLTTSSSTPLTSAIIRSGTKKNGAYAAGNLPLIKASSVANRKRIFVACPASSTGVTKVIMPSAQNFDATKDFVKQASTVTVEGAEGSAGIPYNVWVYEPKQISDDQTFTVTLG